MGGLPLRMIGSDQEAQSNDELSTKPTGFSGSYPLSMALIVGALTICSSFTLFYAGGESVDTICNAWEDKEWCDEGSGGLVMVSYTSVPYPGNVVFGTGMSVTAALMLWSIANLYRAQQRHVRLMDHTDRGSCCCCPCCCGAERLNVMQVIVGCVSAVALVVLSTVSLKVNFSLHGFAAGVFFLSGFTHLLLILQIQSKLSREHRCCLYLGWTDQPPITSVRIKRCIFRGLLVFGVGFVATSSYVRYAAGNTANMQSDMRRWLYPLCQWVAIFVLAGGFYSYRLDIDADPYGDTPDDADKKEPNLEDNTLAIECSQGDTKQPNSLSFIHTPSPIPTEFIHVSERAPSPL